MNKFLFCLIIALLLNQYYSNEDPTPVEEVTGCEGGTADDCSGKTPSDSYYKCDYITDPDNSETKTCTPVLKTCEDASELTDKDCTKLTPKDEEGICFTGTSGCKVAKTCDEVDAGATEDICSKFLVDDAEGKICYLNGAVCKTAAKLRRYKSILSTI